MRGRWTVWKKRWAQPTRSKAPRKSRNVWRSSRRRGLSMVLSCLDLLVKGDRQDYVIRVAKGQIVEMLERLPGSDPDPEVIAAIGQLANQLLAMGHEEFRALARRATPEAT